MQKLFYLPEAHTDFLFAVLAEELGLVGVAVTLALFIGLVWRSFWIAQLAARANLQFQAYLAAGFGLWLGCQALINIGVNMGVLPTKGLTLPLMSYGRSSMIVTLAWVGPAAARVPRGHAERRAAWRKPRRRRSDEDCARAARTAGAERMSARAPILIMAGGTGGHVFPALALARLLRAASHEVVWLGTRAGLEARVVPAENIAIEWLSMSGLRGKGVATLLAAPFKLLQSIWQALGIMRRRRPALVVGFGGFVTGPGGVAAWLMRRPLVIHEQNAIAGYSNRCLAHLARRVLAAFPHAFPARRRRARGRQPGARRNPRCSRRRRRASRGAKARCACWSSAAAWARRGSTPWCRSRLRSCAVGTRRCTCATRPASAASTRRAPPTHEAGVSGEVDAVHRRHGAGLRGRGPGDLPRRCVDHLRAGRRGRGRRCWCRFRRRSTITRPSTRSSWCARARRC